MNSEKRGNETEIEKILLVLQEILDQQTESNKTSLDSITAINNLTDKINGFNDKLNNHKIITPTVDTGAIQELIKKGILDIKGTVADQPKNVTKKLQLLLFPEQDAKLFYKIVFGRIFMWLAIMLFFYYLYNWNVHRLYVNKETKLEELKNDKTLKAWDYLYAQKNKNLHRIMDSALIITASVKQITNPAKRD